MKILLISLFLFLFSCSNFSWENRGEVGEKCFVNGTCSEGLNCIENICLKVEANSDEDSTALDDEMSDSEIGDKQTTVDNSIETDDEIIDDNTIDNETDETADSETDVVPDEDTAAEEKTFYDTVSMLTWQINYAPATFTRDEAISHCDTLNYAGFENWRLPTISELRTLVAGCPVTESTGGCNVKDECLDYGTCRNEPDCNGCEYGKGPSQYKCYFSGIEGTCLPFWSSSTPPPPYNETHAWYMDFGLARISTDEKTREDVYYTACVR